MLPRAVERRLTFLEIVAQFEEIPECPRNAAQRRRLFLLHRPLPGLAQIGQFGGQPLQRAFLLAAHQRRMLLLQKLQVVARVAGMGRGLLGAIFLQLAAANCRTNSCSS